MTVHVTIEMDEAVKARLDALATSRRLSVDEVVAHAVSGMAEEDAAFLAAVDEGLASIEAGRVHSHEDVLAAVATQREARARAR